jgi:pentatricopeptide repeat protein
MILSRCYAVVRIHKAPFLLTVNANAAFALSMSTLSDATEKAEQVFRANRSPNTFAYNKLIDAYAQKGDIKRAFNLVCFLCD